MARTRGGLIWQRNIMYLHSPTIYTVYTAHVTDMTYRNSQRRTWIIGSRSASSGCLASTMESFEEPSDVAETKTQESHHRNTAQIHQLLSIWPSGHGVRHSCAQVYCYRHSRALHQRTFRSHFFRVSEDNIGRISNLQWPTEVPRCVAGWKDLTTFHTWCGQASVQGLPHLPGADEP